MLEAVERQGDLLFGARDELAGERADRLHLRLPLRGDVDDEAGDDLDRLGHRQRVGELEGTEGRPQIRAVTAQPGEKRRLVDDAAGGGVIGMALLPVLQQHDPRPQPA